MVGWDSQIPNAQRSPDGSRFLTELSLAVTSKQLTPELKPTPAKIQSCGTKIVTLKVENRLFRRQTFFNLVIWENRMSSEQVLCIAFHCKNCPLPITLPLDDFERLVPSQGKPPNDDRVLILVCDSCKHANIYSPLQKSPYYGRGSENIRCFRNGVTDCRKILRCAGETREFQAPLIVFWIGDISEVEKGEAEQRWRGEHLKCAAGHSIPWPFGR